MPPGQRLGQVLGDAAAAAVVLVLLRRRRARGGLCGEPERRTPVSRNRVWRMASSLAVCTGTSQSRHRIARSSLQNRSPRFSCETYMHVRSAADRSEAEHTHTHASVWYGMNNDRTWQMSQSGGGGVCCADEDGAAGLSSESRRCLPASLLARCTRRSHASHSAASSAQQNTDAASAAHTSHCTFIFHRSLCDRAR
jgi:hypothetical protein